MEVDGHRVPQGRVLHNEVRRLELRGRPLGDLLPWPGKILTTGDQKFISSKHLLFDSGFGRP